MLITSRRFLIGNVSTNEFTQQHTINDKYETSNGIHTPNSSILFMNILLSSFCGRSSNINWSTSYENSKVSHVQNHVPYYSVILINFEL